MVRHGRRCPCENCRASYTRGADVYVALGLAIASAALMFGTLWWDGRL